MFKLKWKRVGHRTLKLVTRGHPKLIVRFNPNGAGKAKLLNGATFTDEELRLFVSDAEQEWLHYRAMEVAR